MEHRKDSKEYSEEYKEKEEYWTEYRRVATGRIAMLQRELNWWGWIWA